jgi:hypothetical protein
MTPVFTSKQAHNTEVLKDILDLYAKSGDRILDMTYGEGKFWKGIDTSAYELITNDLFKPNPSGHNYDFRRIDSVPESSCDMAILDPPYTHGVGAKGMHADLSRRYGAKGAGVRTFGKEKKAFRTNSGFMFEKLDAKYITQMYKGGMADAWRRLKVGGILVVKTQDEIESGKQVWRHFDLRHFAGFRLIDMFIVTQVGKPLMRHKHQKHARKNHSYFMVYRKIED